MTIERKRDSVGFLPRRTLSIVWWVLRSLFLILLKNRQSKILTKLNVHIALNLFNVMIV